MRFCTFLLDPLPLKYPHVVVVKRPLFERRRKRRGWRTDLKDDYFAWFAECTVRAVELKLKTNVSERAGGRSGTADDADGYVMVRPII